ncbi:MAG: YIP1 family protein [Rhodobacterales bacterium]|nr:MAG: YIP1 family protein [Rhodobacterales bacterium]
MSVSRDIVQSYIRPRRVIRRHLARGVSEGRLFGFLMVACVLVFVAQWPRLSREAYFDPSIPYEGRRAAALWAWIFVAPLLFYLIAWVSYLLARIFGGRGSAMGARLALFWALLVVTPLWLLHGAVAGFIGPGVQANAVGAVLLLALFWVWISGLIETQKRGMDE